MRYDEFMTVGELQQAKHVLHTDFVGAWCDGTDEPDRIIAPICERRWAELWEQMIDGTIRVPKDEELSQQLMCKLAGET